MRTVAARSWLLIAWLSTTACAGTIAPPATTPARPPTDAREALLVLPGFGYSRGAERALRALESTLRADGFDLYVPTFIARSGLESSRENLRRFLAERRLARYERVHVFAFLAGGWTFNPMTADAALLPNLATVIYDRSPYQERAPRIASERLGPLTWLRYGSVVSDVAKTPYPPLRRSNVNIGLVVETVPTSLVKRFAQTARSYGSYSFECEALAQPHDDCIFMALDHGKMYTRFGELWPDIRAFIRGGQFTAGANRTPPPEDAWATRR